MGLSQDSECQVCLKAYRYLLLVSFYDRTVQSKRIGPFETVDAKYSQSSEVELPYCSSNYIFHSMFESLFARHPSLIIINPTQAGAGDSHLI